MPDGPVKRFILSIATSEGDRLNEELSKRGFTVQEMNVDADYSWERRRIKDIRLTFEVKTDAPLCEVQESLAVPGDVVRLIQNCSISVL